MSRVLWIFNYLVIPSMAAVVGGFYGYSAGYDHGFTKGAQGMAATIILSLEKGEVAIAQPE